MVARRRFKWNTIEAIVLKWKYAFEMTNLNQLIIDD